MNKDKFKNAAIKGAIELAVEYGKQKIRSSFRERSKRRQIIEITDEIDNRITQLMRRKGLQTKSGHVEPTPAESVQPEMSTYFQVAHEALNLPEPGWVLPGFIPQGAICNIQSQEKAGKTILCYQVGHECAIIGFSELTSSKENLPAENVVVVDSEMNPLEILKRGYDDFIMERISNIPSDVNQFADTIEKAFEKAKASGLLIVDTVTSTFPNIHQTHVSTLINRLRKLQRKFNERGFHLTVLFIHHTKCGKSEAKTENRAGSVNWGRLADVNLGLTVNDDHTRALTVINTRTDMCTPGHSVVMKINDEPYKHFEFVNEVKGKNEHTGHTTWKLSDKEVALVVQRYVPGTYGLGKLAKDVLDMRGSVDMPSNIDKMKSAIKRALIDKGVYKK